MNDFRTLVRAYGKLPLRHRLHLVGRWRLCPLPTIAAYAPRQGVVVDLGCGHGLFSQLLARRSSERSVIGLDLDVKKIELARQVTLPNLRYEVGDIGAVNLPAADCVTILDVLYLIPHVVQEQLLRSVVKKLAPGGVLILKEMGDEPHWKARLNWLEEFLAVRMLRITLGQDFYFRRPSEWRNLLELLGLTVQVIRIDRGYYHPHVLFVGTKAAS